LCTLRDRLARIAFERGALLGLVALAVYVWLAPAHIVAGDNAEFSTLAALGGRAHPSGYPLYVLWLRAWSWLPMSAAHAASVATALLAGIQVVVLHAACRAWGARPNAATVACAILAAAPIVLRVHTEADVFALNSLAASAILLVAAPEGPARGTRRAALLGLVAGLGLANNLTVALLAPIGIWGVVRGVREAPRAAPALTFALAAFVVGLLPYAYLFVAPDPASWGPVNSAGDLAAMVLRKDYGYTSHLPGAHSIPIADSLVAHAQLIGRTWLWLPALAGLVALGVRCARRPERWAWTALAASWLVCGPLFATQIGLETNGFGLYMGGRMQILSALVLAVPIASAFELIAERTRRALSVRTASLAAVAGFAVLAAVALPALSRQHSRAVEAGITNMLGSLPPGAVVIADSDDLYFGTTYAQLVLGVRPDVVEISWDLVVLPWYRARLAARGIPLDPYAPGTEQPSIKVARQILALGRPLFADVRMGNILSAFKTYPHGTVFRVLPDGAKQLSLDEILALNKQLYAAFDLDYPRPRRMDGYPTGVHGRYASTWAILSRALTAAHRPDEAKAAAELAAALGAEN
jgi:hypothetical protein